MGPSLCGPWRQATAGLTIAFGIASEPTPHLPSLKFDAPARGCGDALIVAENVGGTEVLTVTLTRPRLKLGRAPRTFRIEDRPFGLDVELLVYRERPTHSPHCTDIADPPDAASVRWVATRGRVALAVSHPSPRTGQCYTIDARLQDVVFTHGTREAVLADLVLPPVTVGHRPPLDCTP